MYGKPLPAELSEMVRPNIVVSSMFRFPAVFVSTNYSCICFSYQNFSLLCDIAKS